MPARRRESVQRGKVGRASPVFDAQLASDTSHKLGGAALEWQTLFSGGVRCVGDMTSSAKKWSPATQMHSAVDVQHLAGARGQRLVKFVASRSRGEQRGLPSSRLGLSASAELQDGVAATVPRAHVAAACQEVKRNSQLHEVALLNGGYDELHPERSPRSSVVMLLCRDSTRRDIFDGPIPRAAFLPRPARILSGHN
jgi:hypothetical protein